MKQTLKKVNKFNASFTIYLFISHLTIKIINKSEVVTTVQLTINLIINGLSTSDR